MDLSWLVETISKKKNKIVNFILSDFKNYFKGKLIKIRWNLPKNKHINQLNKIKFRSKSIHKWSADFKQRCQDISLGKEKYFSTNGL